MIRMQPAGTGNENISVFENGTLFKYFKISIDILKIYLSILIT